MTVEIALSALSVVQGAQAGDNWQGDEVTYPAGLDFTRATDLNTLEIPFAYFEYNVAQLIGEDANRAKIYFTLHGEFSQSSAEAVGSDDQPEIAVNRVMKNCHIRLSSFESPTRAFDAFSLQADALDTPYGSADDPRVRWHVHGRFDPASFGDVDYSATLELDQQGNLTLIDKHLNDTGYFSTATIDAMNGGGFYLQLLQE